MARFRLICPHYLNMEVHSEWEQKEVDQATQKQVKKVYKVPTYLDPASTTDHNYPGEIVVTTKADRAFPRDLVFFGKPTMDMVPLDEEAEAMLKEVSFGHPIESLSGTFGEHLIQKFEEDLKLSADKAAKVAAAKDSEIADLKAQLTALTEMVQNLANAQMPPSGAAAGGSASRAVQARRL